MARPTSFKELVPWLAKVIPNLARYMVRRLLHRMPVRVEVRVRRPEKLLIRERFSYQKRYINFGISPDDRVLDIGSGGNPFPYATVLVERFLDTTKHRSGRLTRDDRPLVLANIHNLPFRDKSFDFVYCCHVLEHTANPIKACAEIMRVGKRGYIETPTMGKDALFMSARDIHKWHVVAIGRNLCFFEYSQRQASGIRSTAWQDLIFSKWYHPLQKAFYNNQDFFNVMFTWSDSFDVFVFRLDSTVEGSHGGLAQKQI
jgi:hypothetical protein